MNQDLTTIRKEYLAHSLDEKEVDKNPIQQFQQWFDEAMKAQLPEVIAMTLATASPEGIPSARIVLLREFSEEGFIFYTNYNSHKGLDLNRNPLACLNFFWSELERQVRIQGSVTKISESKSNQYFNSRPRTSQLGAWASEQSSVVKNREELEKKMEELEKKFLNLPVQRPPYWGGISVKPECMEFWQGRHSRLHDRIRYKLNDKEGWSIERLAP